MPKGFIKVFYLLVGAIVLTGCFSQMISPLTFGPLLVLDVILYSREGLVRPFVLISWRVLTWITYIQLVTLFLQFGGIYVADQLEKWENGEQLDLQKQPLATILPLTVGGILFHVLVVYAITWLHFPAVRGAEIYPGVAVQMILAAANFLLGLFIMTGTAGNFNGRSRPRRPRKSTPQKRLGRRKAQPPQAPRGRTSDGTILPKPTHRPQRDLAQRRPRFTKRVSAQDETDKGAE